MYIYIYIFVCKVLTNFDAVGFPDRVKLVTREEL